MDFRDEISKIVGEHGDEVERRALEQEAKWPPEARVRINEVVEKMIEALSNIDPEKSMRVQLTEPWALMARMLAAMGRMETSEFLYRNAQAAQAAEEISQIGEAFNMLEKMLEKQERAEGNGHGEA